MVAAAVVGGAVIGGVATTSASRSASKSQAASAREATAAQREMFDITREDQAPYRALATEVGLPGIRNILAQDQPMSIQDVLSDPGYQFGLDQGRNALQGSAAARGGLYSGRTLQALNKFGNDYATTKFTDVFNRRQSELNNRFNRFATASGIGQAATNQVSAAGQQFGQSAANNIIGAGNAAAANSLAQGNAWTNAINRTTSYGANNGWFGGQGGSVGQPSNMFTNRGYLSNAANGYSNDDVYWN